MNNTTNHKCVVALLFPQSFSPQSRLFIINLETKKTLTLFWSSLILVVNSFLPDLGIFPPEPSQCEPMQRRSNTILSYCFFPFSSHYISQTQFTVSSLSPPGERTERVNWNMKTKQNIRQSVGMSYFHQTETIFHVKSLLKISWSNFHSCCVD